MTFLQRFRQSLEALYTLPSGARYVIAYSGGVDSHVLLYCCHRLQLPVRAVHVHHGLQRPADDWAAHCRSVCDVLAVPVTILHVDAKPEAGQSPEEAAREARYQALEQNLLAGECLVTAQHRDDQAETLLLQLFRGGSSAGLAAMPARRAFGRGVHIRPMLDFSRQEIEAFAALHSLDWVEDPSNRDTRFDRNFLRQQVMPLLQQHWPQLSIQLSSVAALQSSSQQVMDDMAAIDLAAAVMPLPVQQLPLFQDIVSVLDSQRLKLLSHARRLNLLRYWIRRSLHISPSRKLLEEIDSAVLHVRDDAEPRLQFETWVLRKYRDGLYLLNQPAKQQTGPETEPGAEEMLCWQPAVQAQIVLAPGMVLKAVKTESAGLDPALQHEKLDLRYRRGGERFKPHGRRHSQQLKKLLQEAGVPPWERHRIPLLYRGDELVAVVGLWLGADFVTGGGGWEPRLFAEPPVQTDQEQ